MCTAVGFLHENLDRAVVRPVGTERMGQSTSSGGKRKSKTKMEKLEEARREKKREREEEMRQQAVDAEIENEETWEARVPPPPPPPENTLRLEDAYSVEPRVLGEGHYGKVRRCAPRSAPGRKYAVKTIAKSRVARPEMLNAEVGIIRKVRHPNIIEVVDVFDEPGYLHIVTELCTGGELFDRIIEKSQADEKHFSEADAVVVLAQVFRRRPFAERRFPRHNPSSLRSWTRSRTVTASIRRSSTATSSRRTSFSRPRDPTPR